MRLARAHTGKDGYVMVDGGYHGQFDAVLWQIPDSVSSESEAVVVPFGEGVPAILRQLLHNVPFNDANRLEDLLRQHGDEIAALLIEPIMGNCCSITADVEYVKAVRELCDRFDVVMIVDEVKTGFRVARGGVQELMGFRADLCTFAKAMGNGYPIAVIAGREDIMRRIGPQGVAHGGTYTAHSVCLAAAEKTLEILDETDTLAQIESYGQRLQEGMRPILL